MSEPLLEYQHHDHQACARDALHRAAEICARRGVRLTPQRTRVLEALVRSHVPASAYDIADRLAEDGPRPAPISVYRALDFLQANDLVHRIESRNAFLACARVHGEGTRATAFLLCERCGTAAETEAPAIGEFVSDLAAGADFQPASSVVEIRGLCAYCRAEAGVPA